MKRRMGWGEKWRRLWARVGLVPKAGADAEYEALAREFAQLTAKCLEAEETSRTHKAMVMALQARVLKQDRDLHAFTCDVPGLTPGELERLALLGEECGEIARSVGKVLRYGWESASPYDQTQRTNRSSLERELGSMRAVVNLMLDAGDVRLNAVQSWQRTKRTAIEKWTLYQAGSMERGAQLEMMRSIAQDRD